VPLQSFVAVWRSILPMLSPFFIELTEIYEKQGKRQKYKGKRM
jgi:hypothetical protein